MVHIWDKLHAVKGTVKRHLFRTVPQSRPILISSVKNLMFRLLTVSAQYCHVLL